METKCGRNTQIDIVLNDSLPESWLNEYIKDKLAISKLWNPYVYKVEKSILGSWVFSVSTWSQL